MSNFLKKLFYPSVLHLQNRRHFSAAGNVLIYVVVLMLIFGALGVAMVSMFSSSTASTVTRNDTRRAIYMAESGMRYAFSELRKADFDIDFIKDTLNTTTYTVTDAGSFTINVFSPWFNSPSNQAIGPGGGALTLGVPIGTVPIAYTIPLPPDSIYAVNFEFVGLNPPEGGRAVISGYTIPARPPPPDTLTLNLSDDFYANADERIAFAVQPAAGQDIDSDGVDLDLPLEAQYYLPKYGGAITLRRNDYFYEERKEEPAGAPTKVVLTNLSKASQSEWLTTQTDANDWVIVSPRNHMVVPTGESDGVEYGGDYLFGKIIYDASIIPQPAPPDITAEDFISNLSEQETDSRFFETNLTDYELDIGGGQTDEFGSAFFDADLSIGGDQDYCQQGACLFTLGVRAFFLVNFTGQGDGITFTLTSFGPPLTPHNSATSVGGDIQLSELMGYAGDSRIVPNPDPLNDADFVATNPNDRGLDPPKIAVEFDTRTNNRVDDPPPDYCVGPNVETNLRNDPLAANKDAVQYVFWGRTSFLNIPCRGNNPLYDDNRHDADGEEPTEEWRFNTGGTVSFWRAAIGSDGTIYMSALDATLYALNPDGTTKWSFNLTDNNDYMPGIDTKGTPDPSDDVIYSDISGNTIIAIDSDGNELWRFGVGTDIDSTPTVGPDGRVYFGTDSGSLYAIDPDARKPPAQPFPQPGEWEFPTGGEVDNVAALNSAASVVYFVSNDNNLYAVNTADGTERWRFPILTEPNEIQSSPTVNQSDGTIYVGADDDYLYALKDVARLADPTGVGGINGVQGEWRFQTNGEIESSPALDPIDGTIYIGSDDSNVWAVNPDGTEKWRFPTGGNVESSAIVDLDRTIYIGSSDGNVYALNPDGTQKWFFPTGAAVPSSPAIGDDGFIHIGSNDTNFYTISQFADPRNFKDEDKSAGKLLTVEDLDSTVLVDNNTDWLNGAGSRGPFAVRLEVDRALLPNVDGEFDYELRLWIRQCNNDLTCDNILGTFFQDTRIEYDYTAISELPMIQRFSLKGAEQDDFERFFFGFTGAAGAEALDVTVSQFQLSFIRPGDPVVDCDRNAWPLEDSPPLPDCVPEL